MFASMSFYGAIEQLLSGWIFDVIPASDADFDAGQGTCGDDDLRRSRAAIGKVANRVWKTRWSEDLLWSGVLAASSALASIVAARLAAILWRRVFDEDPPE